MENTGAEPSAPITRSTTLVDRLLVNRNFALFWVGEVISTLGDYSFGIVLILWIYAIAGNQSWVALAITGVVLSGIFPPLFLGPFIGVYVDRWDRLRTMIIANVVQGLMVFLLFLTTFWPGGHLPLFWQLGAIYVANFCLITADQFFNQAGNPLLGDIVPAHDFTRAIGRVLTYVYLGTILGPSIGAPIFILFGPRWALMLNVLTFVFSNATLVFVRVPKGVSTADDAQAPRVTSVRKNRFSSEFIAGLQFVFTSRTVRTMLFAMALETLGTAALPVANLFFVIGNLHASAAFLGLLTTAIGLGAVLGSLIGPNVVNRLGEARLFWLCLLADGSGLIVYSRLTTIEAAIALLFLLGIITAFFNLALGPLILRLTPREMMGRTTAVRVSFVSTANVVGAVAAGILISSTFKGLHIEAFGMTFGSVDTVLLLAGVIALLSGVFAMFNVFDPPQVSSTIQMPDVAEIVAQPSGVRE